MLKHHLISCLSKVVIDSQVIFMGMRLNNPNHEISEKKKRIPKNCTNMAFVLLAPLLN